MEKDSFEMDLEDWVLLPNDGSLDFFNLDDKKFSSRESSGDQKGEVDMDHFIFPSHPNTVEKSIIPSASDEELVKNIEEPKVEIGVLSLEIVEDINSPKLESGCCTSSQPFKKIEENEFVDMKMAAAPMNQIEVAAMQFEEKEEDCKGENLDHNKGKIDMGTFEFGGLTIWRWKVHGIGALCSVGAATAAALCVFLLGNQQRHKHQYQSQKLQLQIYANDEKIKQVMQSAARLNQTLSATRVPLARAHFTFGGFCNGP